MSRFIHTYNTLIPNTITPNNSKNQNTISTVKPIFDVLVLGEVNVDLIFNQIDQFPELDKEKLADKMTLTLGSSSAIFASNLSSLGMKVTFIGKIGNDIFGRFCKDQLHSKAVDTSMLIVDDNLTTGATVALSYGESRAMVTHQGAMKYLTIEDISVDKLKTPRHLHFSSYFLQPGLKNNIGTLFKMAKEAGLSTSLDVQWDPTEKWDLNFKEVLPFVDIFLPNELELLSLTHTDNINKALNLLEPFSKIIALKRGSKGSLLSYDGKRIEQNSFHCKEIVDTIGAGDSFNAGFIFKYLQGGSPEDCQMFANLTGAISTTQAGGSNAFRNFEQIMQVAKDMFGYEEKP